MVFYQHGELFHDRTAGTETSQSPRKLIDGQNDCLLLTPVQYNLKVTIKLGQASFGEGERRISEFI
jgi:hypothetical protein